MTLLEFEVPFLAEIRERWFSAFAQARFSRALKDCMFPVVERIFKERSPFYENLMGQSDG